MNRMKHDILIADDERSIRLMLRTALETSGYRVREAANGREVLEEVYLQPPDVVVLDLWMSEFEGMNVLRRLKTGGAGAKPSVIILTGHGSVPLLVRAIQLGASDFLQKPITPEDLRLSVASVLDETSEILQPPEDSHYSEILRLVRKDLIHHSYEHAGQLLETIADRGYGDPEYFNLLGLLHEAEGRMGQARKFYHLAKRKQPN